MILTVTLNAALDRTLVVPNLTVGLPQRATESLSLPGGKGVNVARALKRLGTPVIATGLAGGRTGTNIVEELTVEGILNDFARIQGESRTSTAVVDPTTMVQTELNEYGPRITGEEIELFLEKLRYLCRGVDMVALCGSLPSGAPDDLYARLTREIGKAGLPVALDSTGDPLRLGLAAGPHIVSPNVREAEEIVGYELADAADFVAAARALVELGARNAFIHEPVGCTAVVRQGKGGLTALQARFTAPIEVVSTVGSGDSFLAGLLTELNAGSRPEDAICRAVACGMANATAIGAGIFDVGDVDAFARQVEVTHIELDDAQD